MPTPTYDLLDSVTLSSSASSVTFSSINQGYRDLVLVAKPLPVTGSSIIPYVRFNSDSGSNYSIVTMRGNGSTAASQNATGESWISLLYAFSVQPGYNPQMIMQVMDYSATDKHKTCLIRANQVENGTEASAQRWASTSAISSMTIAGWNANLDAGSTFYLYGIAG